MFQFTRFATLPLYIQRRLPLHTWLSIQTFNAVLKFVAFDVLRTSKVIKQYSRHLLERCFEVCRFWCASHIESHLWRGGFPHSDIYGSTLFCQLPVAFRRLTRPSSPVIAKASTICTYSLDPITIKPKPYHHSLLKLHRLSSHHQLLA